MAGLWKKVWHALGFGLQDPDEDQWDEAEEMEEEDEEPHKLRPLSSARRSTVVSLHTNRAVRVVVQDPVSADEATHIADHLKARRPVIVNLGKMTPDAAQQLVDFLCGATYALGGTQQKIGRDIFLFAPPNINVTGDLEPGLREKGLI